MWPTIKEFFTDKSAFQDVFGRWTNWLRWAVVAIAGVILSGVVPEVTTALGKAGSWGSIATLLLVLAKQSGDITPPAAKALALADPMLVQAHLVQLGVPADAASKAAAKTADQAPKA